MQRYSKKREAVLECLKATKEHPTAEWIYERLRQQYPDLSLATVYRNLNQLEEAGVILSMGSVNGQERYDATVIPHAHAVCSRCSRMVDVEDLPFSEETVRRAEEKTGFHIENTSLRFSGLCRECREKEGKE